MTTLAASFAIALTLAHFLSIALAWRRCKSVEPFPAPATGAAPVTLIRPLCGLDPFERETLASTFGLNYPDYEVIFCVADAADPVIPLALRLIEAHPQVSARLLIGDAPISANPKLNNLVKGWEAAAHDWIIMADSNVLMPADYIQRLRARWRHDIGLVCAAPVGARPEGFWAEVECAFLNTYQARWQYAGERCGFGFAQGKSMLWRRDILEKAGGIRALAGEIAEDAASTKLVRAQGLRVHLAQGPFVQPLGRRTLGQVWRRQLRWARLRRVTFPLFFAPEVLSSSLWPVLAAAYAAHTSDRFALGMALVFAGMWYAAEALLARAAGWRLSKYSLPAFILRDLALPLLWIEAWVGNEFVWRGNAMNVKDLEPAREGPTAA